MRPAKTGWGELASHMCPVSCEQVHFGRDITPEYCAKVYEHVQHIEERYWNTDLLIDEEIEMEDDEGSPF
jgi:hypothetical protein